MDRHPNGNDFQIDLISLSRRRRLHSDIVLAVVAVVIVVMDAIAGS